MILLNETFQQETKNRLENREKIKTCFQEIQTLQKDSKKLSSEVTRNVNKRFSRIKNKNIDLTKENEEKTWQLEGVKILNEELVKDLDKALAEGVKCR